MNTSTMSATKEFEAFLKHGAGTSGPFCTEQVPVAIAEMYHHTHGLSYTSTGYGMKLPTWFKVFVDNGTAKRWYRVYSTCYSNVSTEWIKVRGEVVYVDINRVYE